MMRTTLLARALSLTLCLVGCTLPAARPFSLVVIGNSITHHGPAPDIGWAGHWGMAATSAQTDFVGQLARVLAQDQGNTVAQRFTLVELETNPGTARARPEVIAAASSSDLLVMELGDNVNLSVVAEFGRAYAWLAESARPSAGKLVCLSTWWGSAPADAQIRAACEHSGGTFVLIGDIRLTPGTTAVPGGRLTDLGVLAHPGDAGMAEIAARVRAAWQRAHPVHPQVEDMQR